MYNNARWIAVQTAFVRNNRSNARWIASLILAMTEIKRFLGDDESIHILSRHCEEQRDEAIHTRE